MATKIIGSEQEMLAFGGELADKCQSKKVIYLQGELGAGKTTLVRGFLRKLGYAGIVKSPTYTLVESYNLANKIIFHFDLYRLIDQEELEYIGIRDYFDSDAILLIEWPERASALLPQADLVVKIDVISPGRAVELIYSDSHK